jgi:hypothetical protein
MLTLLFSMPDEPHGLPVATAAPPVRGVRKPKGGPDYGRFAMGLAAVGAGALWLAGILLVSSLMARLQLGYWPDASFCGLGRGAAIGGCAAGDGAFARLAGFLLEDVDAALVIAFAGALTLLAGLRNRT